MLMNQKKFDSMPKDLQEIIDRNSGKALSERFATAWDKAMDDARKATPAEGMVAIEATNYKAMQDAAAGVADAWAKEISEKGIDGKALVEGARNLSSTTR
ncbi:Bacterial extracellular solute-binding protein, family 7 [compost metagenome]